MYNKFLLGQNVKTSSHKIFNMSKNIISKMELDNYDYDDTYGRIILNITKFKEIPFRYLRVSSPSTTFNFRRFRYLGKRNNQTKFPLIEIPISFSSLFRKTYTDTGEITPIYDKVLIYDNTHLSFTKHELNNRANMNEEEELHSYGFVIKRS